MHRPLLCTVRPLCTDRLLLAPMLCVHFCSALTHGWACSGPRPVHAQMPRTKILRTRLTLTSDGAEACDLDAPANTCAYDPEALRARFSTSPFEVAGRVLDIGVAAARIALAGDDGGATLRAELSALGPVFCKIGQTMATRPDIVGLATSRNLGQLQDAMAPEPDAKTAMATLRDSLGDKPVDSVLRGISPSPVAAASLAEVYRATAVGEDGQPVDVALKIQRPGLARKVGLDLFVIRGIIALLEGADIFDEGRVTIIDEVGSGIFDELDFRLEAAHIDRFKRIYARQLRRLGVEAPEVLDHLSSARVLVTAWVDGTPPRDLEPRRRQQFARTAVSCLTMQLMTEGFIHCDPHEGNWLVLPDDRIALLDFGLVAQMDRTHQESMAAGVLNVMAENYDALVPIFKVLNRAPALPDHPMRYPCPTPCVTCTCTCACTSPGDGCSRCQRDRPAPPWSDRAVRRRTTPLHVG